YDETSSHIGKERGWYPITRAHFEAHIGPLGVLVVGDPQEVAAKILRHSQALGGISRFTFQMDNAGMSHDQLKQAISLIGEKVAPLVRAQSSNLS
ncbi:MAG: LLM class flavin-dependent oxidoreductase, partial [Paracoccaceae bacterium]|nr:LLM class flavin-dependent oxidoreductase [Paracoccaceae bacterium]